MSHELQAVLQLDGNKYTQTFTLEESETELISKFFFQSPGFKKLTCILAAIEPDGLPVQVGSFELPDTVFSSGRNGYAGRDRIEVNGQSMPVRANVTPNGDGTYNVTIAAMLPDTLPKAEESRPAWVQPERKERRTPRKPAKKPKKGQLVSELL